MEAILGIGVIACFIWALNMLDQMMRGQREVLERLARLEAAIAVRHSAASVELPDER